MIRLTTRLLLLGLVLPGFAGRGTAAVLDTMREELDRQFKSLSSAPEHPLYYLAYLVAESRSFSARASWGGLVRRRIGAERVLDLDLRVGSARLDNTHRRAGAGGESIRVGLESDPAALRTDLWLETERRYRKEVEEFIKIEARKAVKVEEEDPSPDFCPAPKVEYLARPVRLAVDGDLWVDRVTRLSARFRKHEDVLESWVEFSGDSQMKHFANTEGSSIVQSQRLLEIWIRAAARGEDGMNYFLTRHYPAWSEGGLPDEEALGREIDRMSGLLAEMKKAPLVDPFVGPAILSGRASAVLFHEVLGHRLEGHRQKDEDSDQTFTKKMGQKILPKFISIASDPTLRDIDGVALMGFYGYDDEGVAARRVTLVDRGVLKSFMMSRSPVRGFPESNGHGRKSPGSGAVARQAVLLVESSRRVSVDELRRKLVRLCRKQGRPYGLFFDEIEGGFTFTGRTIPNAFNVLPLVVRRIYADGRPDELVRGVDLIGTPLTTLNRIVAAGDDIGIFNGYCGAESGYVPVAAVSPSLLIEEVEVQRKQKGKERPPLLDAPAWPGGGP